MAGLSTNGLVVLTQPEIQELLEAAVHAEFPGLDLSRGPEHQIIGALSEQLAELWEALQAVHAASYPGGANGLLLDWLMALTGSVRRQATRSTVTATVTLAAATTLPAGSIAASSEDPDAQFRTIDDVTNPLGAEDDVDVAMESVLTGPIAAPSGTLTQIVTARTGWSAITNDDDAVLGREIAGDPEARIQRVTELAGAGAGTVDALRAAVARVEDVQSVTVYENVLLTTDGDGRPGKSFEVVIWDGGAGAADLDEVAQAIWDHKPAGLEAFGITDTGTAIDDLGEEHEIEFTIAADLRIYVAVTVKLLPSAGADWATQVKAAIVARAAEYAVGSDVYFSQLVAAVLDDVGGIEAVTALAVAFSQIASIETADITTASV
jgi:hypothetical protein